MNMISILSDRRPWRHRFLLVVSLLLLLAGPLTVNRFVNFGAAGVFELRVANGQLTLSAPARSTSELGVQQGSFYDYATTGVAEYLLPRADLYGGLNVYVPAWLLLCITYALFRRTKRKYDAAQSATDWCRGCGSDLKSAVVGPCESCGHDPFLRDRDSIARWIARGIRQDLVFGSAQGNVAFRAVIAVVLFIASLFAIGVVDSRLRLLIAFQEMLDKSIPAFADFIVFFALALLACVVTRLALVVVFVDRRSGPTNPLSCSSSRA